MPRPLPAHLAAAATLWASSRAGLTSLSAGLPNSDSNLGPSPNLHALAEEIAQAGAERVAEALDRELRRRADAFLTGLEAYRRHSYRRHPEAGRVVWQEGTTRLLDYSGGVSGKTVLVIPSLINRYYILDLLPERSFLNFLAASGLRPLVVDWDAPGEAERGFGLDDYVAGRLDRIMTVASGNGPVAIVGYCMGGVLALALALRRIDETACLTLLATPWDFHVERPAQARLIGTLIEAALLLPGSEAALPLAVIQGLFMMLDPFLAERKFARFGGLDPDGEAARNFVALEDWLNDGVPLAREVARECGAGWYRDNQPAFGAWRVAGAAVRPDAFRKPALVAVPGRDRIVPPRSAEALGVALPNATMMRPPLGHIGMMSAAAAADAVWAPIAEWLNRW